MNDRDVLREILTRAKIRFEVDADGENIWIDSPLRGKVNLHFDEDGNLDTVVPFE